MERILLVGEDFALLATRAAVLAKTASNITCCNPSEFFEQLPRDEFALVVLCHSLSDDLLVSIAAEIHRRWPQARIVYLSKNMAQPLPVERDVTALATADPRKLADTVAVLLGKPVQSVKAHAQPLCFRRHA
jgi:hypothetical protein